jgi:hypothetical protein
LNTFNVDVEREDDGRWLAEVIELPFVFSPSGWNILKRHPNC